MRKPNREPPDNPTIVFVRWYRDPQTDRIVTAADLKLDVIPLIVEPPDDSEEVP